MLTNYIKSSNLITINSFSNKNTANSQSLQSELINFAWNFFSAKQTVRPSSILSCCFQLEPYFKRALMQNCWKVYFTSQQFLFFSDDSFLKQSVIALDALKNLEEKKYTEQVSTEERSAIKNLMSYLSKSGESNKLNAYLNKIGRSDLWSILNKSTEIFKPLKENYLEILLEKIAASDQSINLSEEPFDEDKQLTTEDIHFLVVSSNMKEMLNALIGFELMEDNIQLKEAWESLEKAYNSPTIQYIKELNTKSFSQAGRVIFYDWGCREMRRSQAFNLKDAVQHIFADRLVHVGITVVDAKNQAALSHLGFHSGKHAIHSIPNPLIGLFCSFGELNILPLLPKSVSEEDRESLQTFFASAFLEIASEEHPELLFEKRFGLNLHRVFFGHKGFGKQSLSQIDFNPEQSEVCSGYVALAFLKTIQKVNLELERLGYEEKIAHPFGEHEIIHRVDILRILYLWKSLNIIKIDPVDPFISKVFKTPVL